MRSERLCSPVSLASCDLLRPIKLSPAVYNLSLVTLPPGIRLPERADKWAGFLSVLADDRAGERSSARRRVKTGEDASRSSGLTMIDEQSTWKPRPGWPSREPVLCHALSRQSRVVAAHCPSLSQIDTAMMTRPAGLNLDHASGFLCAARGLVLSALVVRGHTLDYEEVKLIYDRIMGDSACFTHYRLTLHHYIRYWRSSSESRVTIGPVVQH